jgi:SAM-dependent methyltransferase
MIDFIAHLHGVEQEEQPDYGQDVPGLAKGSAVVGLLTSGIIIFHLVGLFSAGLYFVLRNGTGWSFWETVGLTIMAVLAVLSIGLTIFLVWSSRRGKLQMRDRVIAGLDLQGDEQILDVGCGNGLLLIGAAQQLTTGTAVGVDKWRGDLLSNNSANKVRRNAALAGVADRVQVESSDSRDLPFADGRFDIVLTSLMLHHMDTAGRVTAVREMVRTLKPGGKLVIADIAFIGNLLEILKTCDVTSVKRVSLNLPFYKQVVVIK